MRRASGSKSVSSRSVAMVMLLCRVGRAHRGLRGDHLTAGGPGLHRRAQRQRPERSGGRRAAAILFRDAKPGVARRRKIAAARRCGPGPLAVRSPSRRPWARSSPTRGAIISIRRDRRLAEPMLRSSRRGVVAAAMKRATSSGATCRRERLPEVVRCRGGSRSSLKSPSAGDSGSASIPAAARPFGQASPSRRGRPDRRRGRRRDAAALAGTGWRRDDWPRARRPSAVAA